MTTDGDLIVLDIELLSSRSGAAVETEIFQVGDQV
jgi:hypothetical protein